MALWQRLWLLFTVIWLVVAGLNVATILAFAEGVEREKAWLPVLWGFAVPALLYAACWLWNRWKTRNRGQSPNSKSGSDPD